MSYIGALVSMIIILIDYIWCLVGCVLLWCTVTPKMDASSILCDTLCQKSFTHSLIVSKVRKWFSCFSIITWQNLFSADRRLFFGLSHFFLADIFIELKKKIEKKFCQLPDPILLGLLVEAWYLYKRSAHL